MKNNTICTRIRKLIWEKRAYAEKKRKNRYDSDTYTMILYMLLLVPLILTMALKADVYVNDVYINKDLGVYEIDACVFKDPGVFFTCKRCRNSQWQDAKNADWRGNFYCTVCGVRMGDE
jgi:hypothetical protein